MKRVWAPVAAALLVLGPNAALPSGTVVRSVRLAPRAGAVAIVVEADGPLPLPRVGVLGGPPRIYLDFRHVTTATTGMLVEGHPVLRQVRVALNQRQPLVTRVVIDLVRAVPHRIEAGGRLRGELTVVIGAPAAVQVPPSAPIATPQAPAQAAPPKLPGEPVAPPVPRAPAARPAATPPSSAAPGTLSRTPAPGVSRAVMRSVRLAPGGGEVAILVKADGPLPSPTGGILGGPPRIYLDFRNVTTATAGTRVKGHALVRRVRVALNQSQPPVTRVVIELARAAPYRIEAGGSQRGELTVVIGAPAAVQPAPPSPQAATPPVTPAPAAQPAATPAWPASPGALSRTPTAGASKAVVRSVRLAPEWGAVAIIVEADGPLPSPAPGALRDPPCIYLDFRNVTTATTGFLVEGHPVVRQVRVTLTEAQPPTTRVAIELAKMAPYRIEEGDRERGELTVVVDTQATNQPTPPVDSQMAAPSVPGAQAVRSPAPAAASGEVATRAPVKDVERYLQLTSSALDRLEQLRPLLASLDALTPVSGERLKTAAGEFASIRQALAATEPPRTLKATNELLCTACVLGALSATTRLEAAARGDGAGVWNAASAAASALMLLDRARAELGLSPVRSRERK